MRSLIVGLRLAAVAVSPRPEPVPPPLAVLGPALGDRKDGALATEIQGTATDTQSRSATSPTSPLDRPVTLVANRLPLKAVLDEIARQVGARIAYSRRLVPLEKLVSARFERVSARAALRDLLRGTEIVPVVDAEGQILLTTGPGSEANEALPGSVAGIVRDMHSHAPIPRVAVVVDDRHGAVTRDDGRFVISGVPSGVQQVRVRRLGYVQRDTTVDIRGEARTDLDIALAAAAQRLDEAVSIGYGTSIQRDLTGAVATIAGAQLTAPATPTVTIATALQAKVPGVQIVSSGGMPGAGMRVRVRGTGSITANSEPLYVIDGLPAAQGTNSSDVLVNPLMSIDPGEIESITILKDASATAIYGARGANGVILMTSRRGRQQDTQLRLESSYGIQTVSKRIPVLNGPQYMTLANEARVNAGLPRLYADAEIAGAPTYDYPGLLLRSAPQVGEGVGLSGGDRRLRYNLGGNYMRQEGIELGSDLSRYGLRVNVDADLSSRFRVQTSLNLTRVGRNAPAVENGSLGNRANGIQAAMQFAPFQAPRDAAGNWVKTSPSTEPVPNPIANAIELTDFNSTWRALGSIAAEYDLTSSVALRSTVGGNFGFENNHYYAPRSILAGGAGGFGRLYTSLGREVNNDNALSYSGTVHGNRLEAVAALTVQSFYNEFVLGEGQGFPTDATSVFDLGSGTTLTPTSSGTAASAILSYLGRANYNVGDRLLVTLSNRFDGSSRFGANHKWVISPSAALAWRLSSEPFLKRSAAFNALFNELKLRVGYGKVGNQAVEPYQSLPTLAVQWYSFGRTEIPALAPGTARPNPDLKWEHKTETNVGVDASLWNSRLLVTMDAYHARTNDLLLSVNLPATSGFNSELRNIGAVQNRGLELAVTTANIVRPGMTWSTRLSIAGNRNKVLTLRSASDTFFIGARGSSSLSPGQTHLVTAGLPLGTIFGYRVTGLWQAGEQCSLKATRECTPGEYRLADINGDSVITPGDRVILGYADPSYFGGLTNTVTLGQLSFEATVTFAQGNQIVNAGNAFGGMAIGQTNERTTVLDRWTPTHTNTSVPRANSARPRRLYSSLVEDGSYVRLQSLTLGYQLPERLVQRVPSVRLFVTGQNLWLHSRYTGFDPDVNSAGGDARAGSVDAGAYPRAKVWNVGATFVY